ncbi:ribonuclease-like 3 [Fundulus heteroclitus]|uniref:ribonuclease-like 3 n=1 Tax=Fundulus heteroclitus TaxID=8078 RepID=UPI00165C56A5|nr:ribonuclease-like 3 [Fundulus heteroclitus]
MQILPLSLLVSFLALQAVATESINQSGTPEPVEDAKDGYEKFKRQHIDKKVTAQKCTPVMKQKVIYNNDNSCKKKNTFIQAAEKEVKSVCKGQGVYNDQTHFTESKKKFSVVVCKLKKQGKKPKCEYGGKLFSNRTIVVTCQEGLPVHYEKDHA